MAGTIQGGKHAAETNIKRHGEDFYSKIGRLGGVKGKGHKFAHGKVDPSEAGLKGGKNRWKNGGRNNLV